MLKKSDYMNNLRYVIGDAMEELYGVYNSTDEDKFGETVGVGKGVISKILHDGEITEEDFTSVCCYLNPPKELKTIWKNFYVKNTVEKMNGELHPTLTKIDCEFYETGDSSIGLNAGCKHPILYNENGDVISEVEDLMIDCMSNSKNCIFLLNADKILLKAKDTSDLNTEYVHVK